MIFHNNGLAGLRGYIMVALSQPLLHTETKLQQIEHILTTEGPSLPSTSRLHQGRARVGGVRDRHALCLRKAVDRFQSDLIATLLS